MERLFAWCPMINALVICNHCSPTYGEYRDTDCPALQGLAHSPGLYNSKFLGVYMYALRENSEGHGPVHYSRYPPPIPVGLVVVTNDKCIKKLWD